MKTTIIISTPLTQADTISQIKATFKSHLGLRLVEDDPENMPIMIIKGGLTAEDKSDLSQMASRINDEAVILLIEGERVPSNNLVTLQEIC